MENNILFQILDKLTNKYNLTIENKNKLLSRNIHDNINIY